MRGDSRPLSAAPFGILDTVDGAIAAAAAGEGDLIAPAALCSGKGPRAAAAALQGQLRAPAARANWVERERLRSLLGSCPRSIASLRSGIRCWNGFCQGALGLDGAQIPPALDSLLAWASLFRCSGTFANYLCFVRTVCMLCRADTAVFNAPELARARTAIRRMRGAQGGRAQVARPVGARRKRRLFVPRKKMYIRHVLVARMLRLALRDAELREAQVLCLLAYIFLLRVPSEAIPCVWGATEPVDGVQSCLYVAGDELRLRLASRKNVPSGTELVRGCWCAKQPATCPVHVLGKLAATRARGHKLFPGLTPGRALRSLRRILTMLSVSEAQLYRTHDLRRGHAQARAPRPLARCDRAGVQDMLEGGSRLGAILKAGQWRSPAFLQYINSQDLESGAVLEVYRVPHSGGS